MARRPTDRERHTPAQASERGTAKTVGSGKFKNYSSNLNIATFNVLGLKSSLKRTTLTRDLARCAVDVCSLQETKLTDESHLFSIEKLSLWPRIRCLESP